MSGMFEGYPGSARNHPGHPDSSARVQGLRAKVGSIGRAEGDERGIGEG